VSETAVMRCTLRVSAPCKADGGTPITGGSGMCLACYRACCRPCEVCTEAGPGGRRRLKYEYQEHSWDGRKGCPRCEKAGRPHQGFRMGPDCPQCHGEKIVFERPPERET
jgi:hypothetical protein